MEPTKDLIDAMFRERLLWARRMTPEEKFSAGADLFEGACQVTLAGIRNENPNATEGELQILLKKRLELGEKLRRSR